MHHEIGRAHAAHALLLEVGFLEAREYGDGKQLQLARSAAFHGGVECFSVRAVDSQVVEPEMRDVRRRFLDRVGDVEQLHVEEHGLARRFETLGECDAAAEQQFEPDLVALDRVAERGDERARRLDLRHIDGDE
jgi:hypothetical protein